MPEKICVLCGEDCSTKPRTKDSKGRYYCKSCHDAAREAKRAGSGSGGAAAAATDSPDSALALEDDMAMNMLDEIAPAASGPGTVPCPACSAQMAAGSVVCTTCGYNTQTGQSMKVKTAHPGAALAEFASTARLYINPTTVSLAAMAVYGLLFLWAVASDGSDVAVITFALWDIAFSFPVFILLLVVAFRESIAQGLLTLCVPCYVFYFILAVTDSQWARWLFLTVVVAFLMRIPVNLMLNEMVV